MSSGVNMRLAGLLGLVMMVATSGAVGQGLTDTKKGKGGSEVQGAAGTQGAQGAAGDLERCDKPMGAMAVVEPQDYIMQSLSGYGLGSPVGLIRMMIQQSNCFIVVERGIGMQNMMQERALSEGGQMRQGSNMGGGQMVAADFILTPAVVFSENNAAGIGSALGGLIGGRGGVGGAFGGYSNTNEGDVLYPKIANIKLLSAPSDTAGTVTTLSKADEMIFMGAEQDGFLQVESGKGGGWVKKILVTR